MSKVVVFGAAGQFGRRIITEAVSRGHEVVAAVRNPAAAPDFGVGVAVVTGDVTSADSVAAVAKDADVLLLTVGGPGRALFTDAAATVLGVVAALPEPAPRIVHLGGGASLTTPDGTRFLDLPSFPAAYLDPATGQADALELYRASSGANWTYVSPPPIHFHPGERTGKYRTGLDQPVAGDDGQARLSYEDLAVAVVDEIERPEFQNTRFTAGY
jgi:uncharacterized protein